MATQRCPKCNSKRIRQGYRPTPFLLKLVFVQNLLCDDCNWEFKGFAIPGTVTKKTKKKRTSSNDFMVDDSDESNEDLISPNSNLTNGSSHSDDKVLDDYLPIDASALNLQNDDLVAFSATDTEITPSNFEVEFVNKENKKKTKVKKKVRVKMH